MNLLPSLRPKWTGEQIQTAQCGDNCDQLANILNLYALPKQRIYDVTWGKGVMWNDTMLFRYEVFASDKDIEKVANATNRIVKHALLMDFTKLGYDELSGDVLILDPPYIAGKQTHESLHEAYANDNEDHNAVLRLYIAGIEESWRVLKYGGRIIVKCQDELSGGKQRWTHCEVMRMMEMTGYDVMDLFVLVNETRHLMSGHKHQTSARKNHSYWIVGMKPFARPTKRKDGPKKLGRKIVFGNENNA